MKYLILILLSFTAIADNNIELTGDLDITGTNQTAATAITYDLEGNTVQICIGLTLNDGGGGGGGGGVVNQGFDDLGTSIVISGDNSEIATNPGSNAVSEYVKSVTGHATGYYYAETQIITASGSGNLAFGVVQDSPAQHWLGNNAKSIGVYANGNVYNNGSVMTSSSGFSGTDTLRIWVRDGNKVWLEYNDGTTGTMIGGGNPATGTTPTLTFSGSGTLYIGLTPYGTAALPASGSLRTTVEEFLFSTNGASAWDE